MHQFPTCRSFGKWLKTPLGWARANLYYDKLSKLPSIGSLQETVCLVVQRHRQVASMLDSRARIQASVDPEGGLKAYKDYMNYVQRVDTAAELEKMRSRLENLSEISKIEIAPINPVSRNSPLASRRVGDSTLAEFTRITKAPSKIRRS